MLFCVAALSTLLQAREPTEVSFAMVPGLFGPVLAALVVSLGNKKMLAVVANNTAIIKRGTNLFNLFKGILALERRIRTIIRLRISKMR